MTCKHIKIIFFLLTLFVSLFLIIPQMNFQPLLAQGDHGRDLYAFEQTMHGATPYQDYWWVYGPFMPYYYAIFLQLFGVSIQSVLLGKAVLTLTASLLFYLTSVTLISPILSFIASIWFLTFQEDFFYTYNHIGAMTGLIAVLHALFLYIKNQKIIYLYYALIVIFLLCFIKVNFGLCALTCFLFSIFLTDFLNKNRFTKEKLTFYLTTFLFLPLAILGLYAFFLKGLTLYEIRQCLPYLSSDHPHNSSIIDTTKMLYNIFISKATVDMAGFLFTLLVCLSIFQTIRLILKDKITEALKKPILICIIVLPLFYILHMHEFLVSGVLYRSFWAKPFSIILIFIFIFTATYKLSRPIRIVLYGSLCLILTLKISNQLPLLQKAKNPSRHFDVDHGQIYLGNDAAWMQTVHLTNTFIKENLSDDETLFALPYDPLYYFLPGKKSPTRQLIFFEHINIPEEQEKKIIAELEEQKINWIVLSNRSQSSERGLGVLGETYCPLIGGYIDQNFEMVAQFGDWVNEPGWAWSHGTKILRKKRPNE